MIALDQGIFLLILF